MSAPFLKVHEGDNVMVALKDLQAGLSVNGLVLQENIPQKHKFNTDALSNGEQVRMYGVEVGRVLSDLPAGSLLTTKNTQHSVREYNVSKGKVKWNSPDTSRFEEQVFKGYHRSNGTVGTANHWLVIPLVFCENRNLDIMKAALVNALGYDRKSTFNVNTYSLIERHQLGASDDELMSTDVFINPEDLVKQRLFPNVDGIQFLNHNGGCGGTREDSEMLLRLLAGYINSPNVAGATVLSLGCQHAQAEDLQNMLTRLDPNFEKPVYIFEQQKMVSERQMISEAVKQTFVGVRNADKMHRVRAPLSELTIGLECGGSDGFSGISANPALGYASDLLVAMGGTAILSEFPELNGVEQELLDRCVDETTARKFYDLMEAYSASAESHGSGFHANPSPGNIKDGLITDAIKSAGAARKGGTSPIVDVLDYAEAVTKKGLNLLCTPGNDVESTTGLAGSGANIICFTTGLGTPTGNPIAPTVKISSNTDLHNRMHDLIDINAGTIIDGEDTIESKGIEILEYVIKVANGEVVPNAVRLGQDDFIPWKRGISL